MPKLKCCKVPSFFCGENAILMSKDVAVFYSSKALKLYQKVHTE